MSAATIPVFIFPSQIHFSTHSTSRAHTITLYNPYDYSVKFNILCTKPSAFAFSSSDGVIRSRYCLDIVVRLVDETITKETIQFTVRELTNGRIAARSGQKHVIVTRSDEPPNPEPMPQFSAVTQTTNDEMQISREIGRQTSQLTINRNESSINHCNHLMLYAVALVCMIILWAPSDGDSWYSVHQTHKLVASYMLGLLTYAGLRH